MAGQEPTSCLRSVPWQYQGLILRKQNAKPLKQPLARLTVVHPDSAFLADLADPHVPHAALEVCLTCNWCWSLSRALCVQVNVVHLETCSQPERYSNVRAEPEMQVGLLTWTLTP